jgi:AcrR family transcriptional regulator
LTKGADDEPQNGRQRLIKASLALFADKGFEAVSVRDVAKASGVSLGLIRHHFGSKEGLRTAVDQYFMAQFEEGMALAAERRFEDLEDYGDWMDEWSATRTDDLPSTIKYFRRALLEDSDWGAALFERFYDLVQEWIAKTDARNAIAPDVDRAWLPFLLIYLELGGVLLDPHIARIVGRSGLTGRLWRAQHRAYTRLIKRGIAADATSKKKDP